jgi:hypothetical protein
MTKQNKHRQTPNKDVELERKAPDKAVELERKAEPRSHTAWDTAKRWAGPAIAAYLASKQGAQVKEDPSRENQPRLHANADAVVTYDQKHNERHFAVRLDGDIDVSSDQPKKDNKERAREAPRQEHHIEPER